MVQVAPNFALCFFVYVCLSRAPNFTNNKACFCPFSYLGVVFERSSMIAMFLSFRRVSTFLFLLPELYWWSSIVLIVDFLHHLFLLVVGSAICDR